MLNLAVTGGGSGAISYLLEKGGASSYINAIYIPYGMEASDSFLGYKPKNYCSKETCLKLACTLFAKHGGEAIAVTAKLKSDKPDTYPDGTKRVYEAHIVSHSATTTKYRYVILKGETRKEQERELSNIIIACIMLGAFDDARSIKDFNTTCPKKQVIYSGSFDPLTKNHLQIAEAVGENFCIKPIFEISINNLEKPPIDFITLYSRIRAIESHGYQTVVTNAPMFYQKYEALDAACFVVGTDTMNRIYRYKTAKDSEMLNNCIFYMANRENYQLSIAVNGVKIIPINYQDDGWSSTKERELNV